ncbi:hypothetical protein RHGRI_004745 [Rhododendron griersonianum]|uniref:Uncharacterized protein n=1 Tax=Rhododendron griersonianum TaxID=479676 RepID=A0AAV6LAZ5_9ERIC|nr:hypothetical protein RHGRI_004745 [Rhododendron griersonianum]
MHWRGRLNFQANAPVHYYGGVMISGPSRSLQRTLHVCWNFNCARMSRPPLLSC